MDLNFAQLVFTLKLEADATDRFALFGLRPFFVESFREKAGCGEEPDRPCRRSDACPFHRIFSQPLSADPAAIRRYQKPSLPFVFHLPPLPHPPNRGESVELGLTLVGSTVNSVTEYISAMEWMLRAPAFRRRVSASISKVESVGYGGSRHLLTEPGRGPLLATLSLEGLRKSVHLAPDAISLSIVTPMRLMAEGRPLREFSFSPFVRALFRRVSSMVHYYGESEANLDFKWLADRSRMVECLDADFRWVEWGPKWGGIIGSGTFSGELTEFHPFLLAGEYLQVGKGATFGLGRYILERPA